MTISHFITQKGYFTTKSRRNAKVVVLSNLWQ